MPLINMVLLISVKHEVCRFPRCNDTTEHILTRRRHGGLSQAKTKQHVFDGR